MNDQGKKDMVLVVICWRNNLVSQYSCAI